MDVAEPEQGQLGRYRIGRTLGAGGMGVVYLAEDTRLHRQVAIKKLRRDATSASAGARIQSEAQLLAQLNHPNIVQLHDVLEEDDGIALVMEYVEGTTLKEWMREHNAPLRDKLGLLIQICSGLNEAHSLGIIHRDLKPDNILITFGGTAKITDFGIAKSLQQSAEQITREDHVAGTVDAMSPEQLQGFPLCPRSDLFSLGAIAYELLCGSKPFTMGEGGSMALAQQVVNEPHIPPQQTNPDLPDPLAALLDRLLLKDPGQRPESALQVHEALEFLHQHLSTNTGTREFSDTVTKLLRKPPSARRRTLRAVAGAAGLAAVGVAGYFGWEYATRLDLQYIAVLPVEIHGEVRGEDNAKELTATMVRQALMNAASQLKASALVSFTPKDGQDFDAQLQKLRDKGVTDALFARLDCAQVRCEIELQRLNPLNNQIKQQSGFAFLSDKRQEAEYRITNSMTALFPQVYKNNASERVAMSPKDYDRYINILSRLDQKDLRPLDLDTLETLIEEYPKNTNLYSAYTSVVAKLFIQTDSEGYLNRGLAMLERAKLQNIEKQQLLAQELWLRTYSTDKSQFDALLKKLNKQTAPSATLLAKYARYLYMQGDYKSGQEYAEQAAALNPSADNLYLIAINQTASGNYAAARTTLNRITDSFPEHWSSYSLLGVIELESGNFATAEMAITTIPENLRSWRTKSNLGVAYFLQQKYPDALKVQQQILTSAPNSIEIVEEIAATYLMLGQKDQAKAQYERLLKLTIEKTDLEQARYQAIALANLGKNSEAIALTHELLKKAGDDTYIQYNAGQVYALASEWSSANYYIEQLLDQGMSAEWFSLPAFQQLCTHPQASNRVKTAICN
ncbi:serine/threonine-protein kinase [Microbulbifer hainanensis]|uniref:serine/threonine-protein kinase n=1 Tax=Microbulbifer hainanensis TaxID=2735675 RepID=UPI001866A2B5|nr:serine/threonine-protein kinase [Microbulbifer hainanensis]